jgi:cytochrome c5
MTIKKPLGVLATLALAACASSASNSSPAPAPAASAASSATTASGSMASTAGAPSFSDAQADDGRDIFRAACTECHYSSEFSDSQFKFKWSRRSAGNLYQLIQNEMPESNPGSLSPDEAVSIVSYILRMNGFEPGSARLAADRAVLDQISLASIREP